MQTTQACHLTDMSTDPSKSTQASEILKYLQTGASITPLEALQKFGCFRLGARIWDLRHQGHDIVKTMTTKNGKTFASYRLKEELKSNKCIGCMFWDMWENACMHPDMSGQYRHPDTAACNDFEEESNEQEQELQTQ